MNNVNISEITLEELNLLKNNEDGSIWRKNYRNSPMGRQILLEDFGQDIFDEVCIVWGESATTEDTFVPETSIPSETPTENELLMLAIADLDLQREADKLETQLAIAELAETLLGGVI